MMKRIFVLALAVMMLLSLCACGAKPADTDTQQTTTTTTTTATEGETTTTTEDVTTTDGETTSTTAEETTTTAESTTATTSATEGTTTAPTTKATTTKKTTTTTKKVTTTTTAYPDTGSVPESLSILAVGNSFSVDAMQNHLFPMLKAAGCKNIRLGILYIGGASLDTHYDNVRLDRAKYDYYETTDGTWSTTPNYKASTAFALTDWDVVTLQQVSGHSGRGITYNNLDALIELMRPQIGDAKLYWQMTWAYQQDSTHTDFSYYNKDQSRMYKSIVRATTEKIVGHAAFAGYFPSGTAIQNLRTSALGDTVTADGYHLKDSYGDYTAALTWFCTLTGKNALSVTYRPDEIAAYFDEIAQSVNNAIATPLAVTECK